MNASTDSRIVVVGGGMVGMTAALAAAHHGADVTLLEKGPELGGSFRLSRGLVWTYTDTATASELAPHGDPLLHDMLISEISVRTQWLAENGVALGEALVMPHGGSGYAIDPPQAIDAMTRSLKALGVEVRTDSPMASLLTEDGVVQGVTVALPDGTTEKIGGTVILTTGGFQGNPELVRRYLGLRPENVQLRANRWSTGDGLIARQAAGAMTTLGLPHFYGHAVAAPPASFPPSRFREASQYYGSDALAINLASERFVDESAGSGEEHVNEALAAQPGGLGFYLLDGRSAEAIGMLDMKAQVIVERARAMRAPLRHIPEHRGTLRDAGAVWCPGRTTSEHDLHLQRGSARGSARLPTSFQRSLSVRDPPFQAIGVQAAITFTHGGLAVDEDMRVLSRSGSSTRMNGAVAGPSSLRDTAIPGLFAAGCDVGGFSFDGYVGGLATALVSGARAGLSAASLRVPA